MAFDQIPTSVTIINSGMIGYQGISLTDFTLSSASLIAAGSAVEIAGAFFKASTDITPNPTSWSAISALTSAYLELTPSGTAGSQILTAAWSSTVPTWSTAKQGWYASAGSNVRVVATAYKTAGGNYNNKCILQNDGQNDYRMRGITVNILGGSGNWIVPTDVYRLSYICIPGGAGGGGGGGPTISGANGLSGGSTIFGSTTVNSGGPGYGGKSISSSFSTFSGRGGEYNGLVIAGASGSPGQKALLSGSGATFLGGNGGAAGGTSFEAGAGVSQRGSYGGGGAGGLGDDGDGGGGGAGTVISPLLFLSVNVVPNQSIAYSVGSGGQPGVGGDGNAIDGGTGGSGIITIQY